MFDLFRSREKNVRYILIGLLSLVALSLVITLIPNYSGLGSSNQDVTVIAEVGGEKVTAMEVRQALDRAMRDRQLPREMVSVYVPMIAQQLIASKAVAYQAEKMGFKVSDTEAVEIIRSILPSLFQNGQFVGREQYAAMLAQQNMTIPMFEANVKKQAAATRLEVMSLEGVIVTPQEVEDAYRKKNDRIVLSYASVSEDKYKAMVTVSPEEMKALYEQRKANFTIPEKRTFLVYPIEEAKLAATLTVPDEALKQAYQASLDSFRTPDRVRVRHILLKTEGKSEPEIAATQKKIEELLKQVRGGADFAQVATKNSEDTGSAVKGGDLDWVTRGQTVAEFEKAAFSMKPGEIAGPVKTMYGFHILKAEAREDARVKPFEEVKEEIKKNVVRQQVFDRMQTLADQVRTALTKSPEEADKVAAAAGLTGLRSEKIGRGDLIAGVGANQELSESAWSLPVGGVTPVVTLDPTKLAVVRVQEIVPVRPALFAEVQDQIKNILASEKAAKMTQDKVKEFGDKLKASNGDLAAVAKQMGIEVKTTSAFSRAGNAPGIDSGARFEEGFRKNTGDTFGPVQTPGGSYFCKIVEKQPADLTQLAVERDQLVQTLKGQRSNMRRELLYDGIVNALTKDKSLKIYEDNIKKLAGNYGG
jgi:peptidyl-prolyl cis-trans isomerase D